MSQRAISVSQLPILLDSGGTDCVRVCGTSLTARRDSFVTSQFETHQNDTFCRV
jgi:hypothetical protein